MSTAEEFDEELLKWDDDVDDPKIQLVESLINSGHVFTKAEWPEGDFTCPRVLSPYEKTVIKDYEVALEHRKKDADLLKRKRQAEDVVSVESDDFQDPPKRTRTRAATTGRRTGAVVAAVQQDMTIADAVIKMQEFFCSEFKKLALAQQPTKPWVKKSIPKRPLISLSHSPSGDIYVSATGKAGEAAFAAEMEENRMFDDYDGVASVLQSVKDVDGDMDENKGNEIDIENDADGNDISGVERVYGVAAADGREKVVPVKDMEIKDVHSDAAGDELHTFTAGTTDVVLLYTGNPDNTHHPDEGVETRDEVRQSTEPSGDDGDGDGLGKEAIEVEEQVVGREGVDGDEVGKCLQLGKVDPKFLYDPLASVKKGAVTRMMKLVEVHSEP
ncbi:hypothetical protein AALP_AA5G184600 [Arabis alpina]|uniref:Uncharacterized protein n=1 Tax=Arabis alpina TaxID=50452 RepID=A0A087GXX5_ARAAL|nr:hypothetical protein AALP_AA5G184600 [Arabis alpina]